MHKTLLIIPGFGESTKKKPYQQIIRHAKSVGYGRIIEINPTWNYKTVSDWYTETYLQIKNLNQSNLDAVGFSFGAYILLLLSKNISLNKVLYCSLSPYFKNQLSYIPMSAKKFFGKRRVSDFEKHSLPKILQGNKNIFFFGDQDWKFAIEEAKKYARKTNSTFEMIKNSGHELTEEYLEKVKSYI